MKVVETAFAKINLGLKIVRQRRDGYHDILSLFQAVSLADKLEITLDEAPGMSVSDTAIPSGPKNLVMKAESLLRTYAPSVPEAAFQLEKWIPAGAGLGGGSSDAAAALRGLRKLHALPWTDASLRVLAAGIGSDVPFFITGGTAVVSGRGEVIEPVDWPFSFHYCLIYPGFPVPTGWAYSQLTDIGAGVEPYREMIDGLKAGTLDKKTFLSALRNDFETPVFQAYPLLGDIKRALTDAGADAAFMSGSGSTMVGLFDNRDTARKAADKLARPGWNIVTVSQAGSAG